MHNATRHNGEHRTFASPADRQAAARQEYRASLATGSPLTGRALGANFERSDRWGHDRIAEARAEIQAGTVDLVPPLDGQGTISDEEHDHWDATAAGDVGGLEADDVPWWVGLGTTLALIIVVAAAARASFDHLHKVATMVGEGERAWLLPMSVDGLLATASMVVYRARKLHQPTRVIPLLALVLGVVGSVTGNIIAVAPDMLDLQTVRIVVAACPPIALALSFEMALHQVR